MNTISTEDSKRIEALRFLLMIGVVFIHNNFTDESIAKSLAKTGEAIVFNQSAIGKWIQLFISDGLARCAVPLFFLFSAFLQAKKDTPYPVLLKKRARTLLVPYALWLFIYFLYPHFAKFLLSQFRPALLKHPDDIFLNWTTTDWFHKILGYGEDGLPEFAIQFWYIRDLLILTALSPVLSALIERFRAGFFALVAVVYVVPLNVHFAASQALFFYTAGLYWGMFDLPLLAKIDRIKWSEAAVMFLVAFDLTYLHFGTKSTMYYIMVIFACVLALKASASIMSCERIFCLAKYLSGYSFFLFAVHTPVLNSTISKLWLHFLPMTNGFFCLAQYFGVNLLTIAIGTATGIAIRRICSPLFSLLTGNRVPKRF